MKIILKKVRKRTPFTWINPIKVEPLELEYLKAVIDELALELDKTLNLESDIVDELYHGGLVRGDWSHKKIAKKDIIILTGYNTARNQMIAEARQIKEKSPETIVIASGVDVQINWKLYEDSLFDYLIVSNQLSDFKDLLVHIILNKSVVVKGVLSIKNRMFLNNIRPRKACLDLSGDGLDIEPLIAFESVEPSRTYFEKIKNQTRYLLYDNVALVKRSHGCPYNCEFCFCKQLNQGHYVSRSYEALKIEMANIKTDYYWIVDDVFIHNEVEAVAFLEAFENNLFKMIVYLRADFIVNHSEIMQKLKDAGIIEVITGFESIKAQFLEDFNKGYAPDINTKAITVLNQIGLSFTALFMVDINDDHKDFRALKSYIKKHQIQNYTFSIFTPLSGTTLYDDYEEEIIDFKCEHYDFLHLVLKPLKMSVFAFKFAFMGLYIFQFFHSKMARQIIYKLLKDSFKKFFLKRGGNE